MLFRKRILGNHPIYRLAVVKFFLIHSALLPPLALNGCSRLPRLEAEADQQSAVLFEKLRNLGVRVDRKDALNLAQVAVNESVQLAREFRAVRPAWLHNILVNNGIKKRGRCYEWTNDLFIRLKQLSIPSLDLYLAVARMDTAREHNAIVVTPHGELFETGLVLDAWRESGRLWFGPVRTDKYPWAPLPAERMNEEVRRAL